MDSVWVFVGSGATFPAAIFADESTARKWIAHNSVSGMLTEYPVGVSVYEWANAKGYWAPKRPDQKTPAFIGRFTSAHLTHYHFEDGRDAADDAGPG